MRLFWNPRMSYFPNWIIDFGSLCLIQWRRSLQGCFPYLNRCQGNLLKDIVNKTVGRLQPFFTYVLFSVKIIYPEKVTKFCKISTLLLTVCTVVKSKVKISQNFVAFSEYMNFTRLFNSNGKL